jgi:hypothetical protein
MGAARQQRGEFGFVTLNRLHVPVALAAMALLLAIPALGVRHGTFADIGCLAATAAVALLANAVVCGVFATPHDRYGARLVWIAPRVVVLALARAAVTARAARQLPRPAGAAMLRADSAL